VSSWLALGYQVQVSPPG